MKTTAIFATGFAATLSLITVGATLSLTPSGAVAAEVRNVTEDQITRALAPHGALANRSLSSDPQAEAAQHAARAKLLRSVRGRNARSLSLDERELIATAARDQPNIDLEITFSYDSAQISAKSMPSVKALGNALTKGELKGSTFIVAGYTDAAGGDAYNQQLSERRADTIRHYLIRNFDIAASDLVTVGYGKTKLKDPGHPLDEANRRVQVVNMENQANASK
ncbi:MAG: OmpA family protein [Alphaproteobacteria bacterium]|nr:OmpA family protein [Alphaproteobacteria bacterium]